MADVCGCFTTLGKTDRKVIYFNQYFLPKLSTQFLFKQYIQQHQNKRQPEQCEGGREGCPSHFRIVCAQAFADAELALCSAPLHLAPKGWRCCSVAAEAVREEEV